MEVAWLVEIPKADLEVDKHAVLGEHERERSARDLVMDDSGLVIVIPALNEAKSVEKVLDEIVGVFADSEVAVVVVDGHSTDGTDDIARKKGAHVIYQWNHGYGDALRTGFLHARDSLSASIIVMMDADFTYDANDIPKLVEPILKGKADLVLGNRLAHLEEGAMPFINRVGNRILSWVAKAALRIKVCDTQCGLRAFRSELVECMDLETEGMPLAIEMLAEAKFAGARIVEVPVTYRKRVGDTKLNPLRDGLRILGTTIRLMRDTQPLLFFGGLGAFLGIIGLAFGIDVTLEWFRTGTVGRVPTVMLASLLMISGVQLFALGLVADMIKKLRRTNRVRPLRARLGQQPSEKRW